MAVLLGLWLTPHAQTDSPEVPAPTIAQPPLPNPPTNVRGSDAPNDDGGSILVSWTLSPDDGAALNNIDSYRILRGASPSGPFDTVGSAAAGQTLFTDAFAEPG